MLLPRVSANRLPSPANRNRRTFAQLVDRWLPTRARFFCVSRPAVGRPENRMCQLPDLPNLGRPDGRGVRSRGYGIHVSE